MQPPASTPTESVASVAPERPELPEPPPSADLADKPAKPRLRDVAFGIRSLAAVAVASLILGGVGGVVVGAVGARHHDDDRGPRGDFGGPGMMQQGGREDGQFPGQFPGPPPQQMLPGQGGPGGALPPTQAPTDGVQPDGSSGSSSGSNNSNS